MPSSADKPAVKPRQSSSQRLDGHASSEGERAAAQELVMPPEFDGDFQERLKDLIAWRRDVRRFRRDGVPQDILDDLLGLANLAPSVGNSQPWRWVNVASTQNRAGIIQNFERENNLAADTYDSDTREHYLSLKLAGLREAPVHYAVFCDEATNKGRRLGRQTMPEMLRYSAVLSVHTFWLAARAYGIGVGWVSIVDPKAVATLLDVPDDWALVAYLCVGWPEDEHVDPELQRAGWEARQNMKIIQR